MSLLFKFEDEFVVQVRGRVSCSSSWMSFLFEFADEFVI